MAGITYFLSGKYVLSVLSGYFDGALMLRAGLLFRCLCFRAAAAKAALLPRWTGLTSGPEPDTI
jgi:hypothetical protein